MLTKKQMIAKLGMREMRRRGLCDKNDQLQLAADNLITACIRVGLYIPRSRNTSIVRDVESSAEGSPQAELDYLSETLKEFDLDK